MNYAQFMYERFCEYRGIESNWAQLTYAEQRAWFDLANEVRASPEAPIFLEVKMQSAETPNGVTKLCRMMPNVESIDQELAALREWLVQTNARIIDGTPANQMRLEAIDIDRARWEDHDKKVRLSLRNFDVQYGTKEEEKRFGKRD